MDIQNVNENPARNPYNTWFFIRINNNFAVEELDGQTPNRLFG